jgi:hydrogenase maturation protein HypF
MERRAIDVTGIVQGVGFRPFVHSLATRLHLSGFVTNHGGRVQIEVEGDREALEHFERELTASAPPLAHIESMSVRTLSHGGASLSPDAEARSAEAAGGRLDHEFRIEPSRRDASPSIYIAPDVATCEACLAELFDPANRRYRYPFINCTACGPRLTIITGSPYDRERTTMARFEMCERCRTEYLDPADRRFHAEPIACRVCGPRLEIVDGDGCAVDGDPLETAALALTSGRIVAVKGLGGFHLACDAGNDAAVVELRRRKHRDEKPFAVMVADADAAASLCDVSVAEADLLRSPARPIVLLEKSAAAGHLIAAGVAPQSRRLGVMLPYTPLHHLLMSAVGGRALVMTSGNRSDEPIAIANDDARVRLKNIADLFLVHDRDIRVRCEDSVLRHVGAASVIIRRSRGYAPAPIGLAFECPAPILAVGGHLKNTFALGRGRHAFLSHHAGDLDELLALDAFERDIALYERLFDITPSIAAYDLHPDYASTRFALRRTALTLVGVQHHHAHIASCMAEHGLEAPVIGVAWDGAGWGPDTCVWGGEFLVGDRRDVQRAAHFRYVPQPGGDRAAREPWRMALAHLRDARVDEADALRGVPSSARKTVAQMIERRLNAPMTSSVGRLFDAVAALCGGAPAMTFEGQAAMWLESLADQSADPGRYPFALTEAIDAATPMTIDTRPLIRAVDDDRRRGASPAVVARRFHTTLADVVRNVARILRARTAIARVVLSGGVFLNAILTVELETRLAEDGFEVYRHRVVSPGDGGLSLGQLAVAAARIAGPKER